MSPLPFDPEEIDVLKARAQKALIPFIPSAEFKHIDEVERHVFDFKAGYRIAVWIQPVHGWTYWHACFRRYWSTSQQMEGHTFYDALVSIGLKPPNEEGLVYLVGKDTHFIHRIN